MTNNPTTIPLLGGVFRFRDLPKELRLRVYELHLTTPGPVVVSEIKKPNLGVNLLLACHQLYNEAKPILYGKNKLQLWCARACSCLLCEHSGAGAGCHNTYPDTSVANFITCFQNHRTPPPVTNVDLILFAPCWFRGLPNPPSGFSTIFPALECLDVTVLASSCHHGMSSPALAEPYFDKDGKIEVAGCLKDWDLTMAVGKVKVKNEIMGLQMEEVAHSLDQDRIDRRPVG